MSKVQSLFGKFFIYFNKGNNKHALFRNEEDYYQFLDLYKNI